MRRLRVLALVLVLLAASGCWDYRDIDRRTPVLAFGVDFQEGRWTLTVAEVVPESPPEGRYESRLHTASGPTLDEAIEAVEARSARRLYLGEAGIAVLGRGVLRSGIDPVLRTVLTPTETSPALYVVGSASTAKALLSAPEPSFGAAAVHLERFTSTQQPSRGGYATTLAWQALSRRHDEGGSLFVPMFKVDGPGELEVIGTSVIGPAGKEVLSLDREETQTLRWLLGISGWTYFALADGSRLRVESNRASTAVDTRARPPCFRINVKLAAKLRAAHSFPLSPQRRSEIERMAERVALSRLLAVASRLRQRGADVLRLGETLRQSGMTPSLKDQLPIHISVTVQIDPEETVAV